MAQSDGSANPCFRDERSLRVVRDGDGDGSPEKMRPVEPLEAVQTSGKEGNGPPITGTKARRGNAGWRLVSQVPDEPADCLRPYAGVAPVVACLPNLPANHRTVRCDQDPFDLGATKVNAETDHTICCAGSNMRLCRES